MDIRKELEAQGIRNVREIHRNLAPSQLIERSLAKGEGMLAANGALVVKTGERTGRSPNDKFIAEDASVKDQVAWGKVNVKCEPAQFNKLLEKACVYLQGRDVYVFDGFAGADPNHRLAVRVITDTVWHALFAQTLFIRPTAQALEQFTPGFTVMGCGAMRANPALDGTRSDVFVGVSFEKKTNLVIGSMYGGEIKKSIFTIMNYLLPQQGVFPMHCSANVGANGETALFFGLSGTGKTTLSADPKRRLIGDDEHGWCDTGIFNFEGGCYAKVIKLSAEAEPQIFNAIRFGSLLENVVVDPASRAIDYNSDAITENTRATYPVEYIPNCVIPGVGAHPRNVFFLACDAFGVLPPIAKLTPEAASYHFLSGFTAKLAGTESGVTEPQPTFSTCFGAPFMPLHPTRYATMLAERLAKQGATCWLVNTGWSGGPVGTGSRMKIGITRALLTAALEGTLQKSKFSADPIFNVLVPDACEGVPSEVLTPRNTWQDKAAYDKKAKELAAMFIKNFEQYKGYASAAVIAAGPKA
ncbi:MAG TPA: phosphoenolpyruvate carboxykinase (ATP) [Candidatus Edwardsbacteria bacterium]|nr:phosphoenolpyruvate carboxykinase (ATP) [Candidatus Edwardsbacteria bacterium]